MPVASGVLAVRTAVQGTAGHNLIYQVHVEPIVADTLFFAGTAETINIDVPLPAVFARAVRFMFHRAMADAA